MTIEIKKVNKQLKKEARFLIESLKILTKNVELSATNLNRIFYSRSLKRIPKHIDSILTNKIKEFNIERFLYDCERLRKDLVDLIFRTGYIKEEDRSKLDEIALALGRLVEQNKQNGK